MVSLGDPQSWVKAKDLVLAENYNYEAGLSLSSASRIEVVALYCSPELPPFFRAGAIAHEALLKGSKR